MTIQTTKWAVQPRFPAAPIGDTFGETDEDVLRKAMIAANAPKPKKPKPLPEKPNGKKLPACTLEILIAATKPGRAYTLEDLKKRTGCSQHSIKKILPVAVQHRLVSLSWVEAVRIIDRTHKRLEDMVTIEQALTSVKSLTVAQIAAATGRTQAAIAFQLKYSETAWKFEKVGHQGRAVLWALKKGAR